MRSLIFVILGFASTLSAVDNPISEVVNTENNWNISIMKILVSVMIFIIATLVLKYLTRAFEKIAERWTRFRLGIKRIIPIVRIIGWTISVYIIIVGVLRPPFQTIVAVTASAGIAIGFASQDILKNIFGGVMILFDRPFQVGDKIQVGSFYGEVLTIGLRSVRIVTPDDSVVSIPNSEIVNQSVSNSNSGETNCQVVAEFYLDTDIDFQRIKKIAYQSAVVSRYAYLKKPVSIVFKQEIHMGKPKIKLRIKAYVLDIRYEFAFMSDITQIFQEALQKELALTATDM